MNISELEEKIRDEIKMQLWRLGDDSRDSVFPNFDLNSHELEYGIEELNGDFIVETKVKTKDGRRILVKIKIDLVAN